MAALGAGVIFLVVMQTTWAGQAAKANKKQMEKTMMDNVSAALYKIQDEMEVIYSLLYIEPESYEKKNWTDFYGKIDFLEKNTRFFNFTTRILLLPLNQGEEALRYDRQEKRFVRTDIPAYVADYRSALHEEAIWDYIRKIGVNAVTIIPVVKEAKGRVQDNQKSMDNLLALIAIEIDTGRFYSEELPLTLSDTLDKYYFRIRKDATVYYSSPGKEPAGDRPPDFRIPVILPFSPWLSDRMVILETDKPPDSADIAFQARFPNFRFLIQRRKIDPGPDIFIRKTSRDDMVLEIYYPGGSFNEIIERQTIASEAASIAILAALVASLIFLYRHYARMRSLREREQEFVATITHELRTPLAVIQSASDNLSRGIVSSDEKIMKYGRVMREQVKRLALMVENVLRYAGLGGNGSQKRNHDSWIDLVPFVEGLVDSLAEFAEKKQARIHYKEDVYGGKIKADPVALALVLENLLTNAILHGAVEGRDANPVRLHIRKRVPYGMTFVIEDEGPGIQPREQKKIFEPFFRGAESMKKQIPGSGLGLHLVKRITEMCGGSVSLESPYRRLDGQEQRGCRFVLQFQFEATDVG